MKYERSNLLPIVHNTFGVFKSTLGNSNVNVLLERYFIHKSLVNSKIESKSYSPGLVFKILRSEYNPFGKNLREK